MLELDGAVLGHESDAHQVLLGAFGRNGSAAALTLLFCHKYLLDPDRLPCWVIRIPLCRSDVGRSAPREHSSPPSSFRAKHWIPRYPSSVRPAALCPGSVRRSHCESRDSHRQASLLATHVPFFRCS